MNIQKVVMRHESHVSLVNQAKKREREKGQGIKGQDSWNETLQRISVSLTLNCYCIFLLYSQGMTSLYVCLVSPLM